MKSFRTHLAAWMKSRPWWLKPWLGYLSLPLWPVGIVLFILGAIGTLIWSADTDVVKPLDQ